MANKPTYFLTPPRPYPPSGPIRLGAIIPSPTLPDEPIFTPSIEPSDTSTINEQKWTGSHVRKSLTKFGIWTSFMEMILSIGADISVKKKSELKEHWHVENMCTTSFVPTQAFVEETVAREEVRSYVVGNKFREKIYMITGVMVASCSTVFRETLEDKGIFVSVGVDATAWTGVPISVGPEGKWKKMEIVRESSERKEDFVFAFRIRQIKVTKVGGVKKHKLYDKGALFNLEGKDEAADGESFAVAVEGLGEEVDGEDFGLDTEESANLAVGDEDEQCYCVLPETDGF